MIIASSQFGAISWHQAMGRQQCQADYPVQPSLCIDGINGATGMLPVARPQLGQFERAALTSDCGVMPIVTYLKGRIGLD